ncbi:hypothetical protein FE257_006505 [Aspergillus nanangensis]|uniref:Uncharacterized protein n=1 Tax=Aspergillus nanangensis TaxID=2582783 RepID=A0AAD4CZJ5_ASPNN|nr:hypothetical protein FE257_006505 [Aspergillus nanangensis]
MRFFALLAVFATATVALPSEASTQELCIGMTETDTDGNRTVERSNVQQLNAQLQVLYAVGVWK